ncbi:Protein BZZ1 [Cryptotrichosporon argae]
MTIVAVLSDHPPSPPPFAGPSQPWTRHPSRPHFLPPSSASPSSLTLIADTLELAREYRDLVDALARAEAEYGRAQLVAVRKFEGKLDALAGPLHRGFEGSLHAALRAHLEHNKTVAGLHQKHQAALAGQLVNPLAQLERRGAESHRRLAQWSRDVRARWDDALHRVDKAKRKYHAAVDATQQAAAKRAQAAAEGKDHEAKAERAVLAAEREGGDRKRAYVVALAGDGQGGLTRVAEEGGGKDGWGEEAKALYTHLHGTLASLFHVHAGEDASHLGLLSKILERAKQGYAEVSADADCAAYLALQASARPSLDSEGRASSSVHIHADVQPNGASESPVRLRDRRKSSGRPATLDALRYPAFEAPPTLRDDTQTLDLTLEARDWLVNRWVASKAALAEVEGKEGDGGLLAVKEAGLEHLKELCVTYGADRGLGDPDEIWEQRLAALRELGPQHVAAAIARAEMACIENVLDCDPAPESPHELAERSFPTPSPCSVCALTIWSPLTPELYCKTCAATLHRRCALYVDPECTGARMRNRRTSGSGPGSGSAPSRNPLRRGLTNGANRLLRRSSVFAHSPHGPVEEGTPDGSTPEPVNATLPLRDDEIHISPFLPVSDLDRPAVADAMAAAADTSDVGDRDVGGGRGAYARVVHSYDATSEAELSVCRGEVVHVVEPDLDGLGWVRVSRGMDGGDTGLVPLSYLGIVGFSTPPLDGGGGRFVVATYDFPPPSHPPGPGEARVARGAIYELSDAGMAFSPDWCELVVADPAAHGVRVRGFVPKTYVREV